MRILILGGTVFLGRALVDSAQRRGHVVTLFNRGKSNPTLFTDIEQLHGNRDGGLEALKGRRWDAVIDTSGYVPRIVRQSATLLSRNTVHYTFISSLSVYGDVTYPGADETAPLATMEDETIEEVTGETYGPLKVLCERAVQESMPDTSLIIRPGLIVGPHDPTDRFTYWPVRIARGGEVLTPGRPERGVQFIDVCDLADWNVQMIEKQAAGIYNANGPESPLPMGNLLETCRRASHSDASLTWVDDEFLIQQGVEPWIEMPLWVPESEPMAAGFFAFSSAKAIAQGLTFRPVEETVLSTLEWASTRPPERKWRAGLDAEKEASVLAAWRQRTAA